jgi:membrane protein required for colicin V production
MIDFSMLTIMDYGVLLILIVSCLIAVVRGMTREFLGLIGWVISFFVANYVSPQIVGPLNGTLDLGGLGEALSWGLPFSISVVVWFILASMIAPGLARGVLGSFDRWLGILFGFARGVLLVLIVFIVIILPKGEDGLPDYVKESQTTTLMSFTAYHLSGFLPNKLSEKIINSLSYRPDHGEEPIAKKITNSVEASQKTINNSMKLLKDEKAE